MFDEYGRLLVQGALTGGIGGLIVYLLTLPQRRRKISAGASVEEAQAATTLSGEALRWVNEARAEAAAARHDADECRRAQHAAEERHRDEVGDLGDRIDMLERRERDLEDVIRAAGLDVPPRRRGYDQRPTTTRSVDHATSPPPTGDPP